MEALDNLKQQCVECRACGLCETRHNVVFGVGNPESEILFVGEGPGENEDLRGVPFVGRAGQLLDDMLRMIDLDRNRVYIANIVKCRPPNNRDPSPEEQAACQHWLDKQIDILQPKIIVCLGRIAATAIIRDDFKITKEHGIWFDIEGRRVTATFHPSALLRDLSKRPEAFSDLRTIRAEARKTTRVYE